MHVWIAKPCNTGELEADGAGIRTAAATPSAKASSCSAEEQNAACADIIVYHMKENLPAGASSRSAVYMADDESCRDLGKVIRSSIGCRYSSSMLHHKNYMKSVNISRCFPLYFFYLNLAS